MASVVVAGRKPLYELKAADLVVKKLSELRVINLQQLFSNEELVNGNVSNLLDSGHIDQMSLLALFRLHFAGVEE